MCIRDSSKGIRNFVAETGSRVLVILDAILEKSLDMLPELDVDTIICKIHIGNALDLFAVLRKGQKVSLTHKEHHFIPVSYTHLDVYKRQLRQRQSPADAGA